MSNPNLGTVIPQLSNEWKHPSQTSAVLTLVGPDVIRSALAQLAGTPLTPTAFSFGWVAYAFSNLVATLNGGTLMPQPEIPCLVINADSGYQRDNRSWVIGRVLRDFQYWWPSDVADKVKKVVEEARESDRKKGRDVLRNKAGLCISVFSCSRPAGKPVHDFAYYSGFIVVLVQLAISSIPFGISGDWVPFLLTFSGIVLAFTTGALPHWKEEKWGAPSSKKRVILTCGNGAQHAIVIDSREDGGVDFEALAALEPTASLATRIGNVILAVLWIIHLITLAELDQDGWYFMAVGGIGMAHNVIVAGVQRRPAALGIHLDYVECFADPKAMKALQAVQTNYPGVGASMLPIFFPGELRPEEKPFWNEQKNQRPQEIVQKI
ncbi:hypothetical protein OG21DRAFT_1451348 [Imleria badia]|nr:hypothetical protein OG21DRAFT_1451348 [Imleria badia]